MASIASDAFPIIVCGVAVAFDLHKREIPDTLSVLLIVGTCIRLLFGDSPNWWSHLLGGMVALLLAALVGRKDRFGGGDVKLFAALTFWFGLSALVPLAMWIALAGLPLSILAALRKQADLAYAPQS